MENTKKKKKMSLTTVILLALVLGAVTGALLYSFASGSAGVQKYVVNGVFYVLGQGFIRLMQMLVIPLVFCSLVCGTAQIGGTKSFGRIGGGIIGLYLLTTTLALTLALFFSRLTKPGVGLNLSAIQMSTEKLQTVDRSSIPDTLLNIIPKNVFESMANGDMLPIIVFALIVGVIIGKLGDKVQTVSNFFSQFNDIMMEMTMMVMKVAPIGVFCLIAKTFATVGARAMAPLLKYLLTVLLVLVIQVLVVYMTILWTGARVSPFRFLKKFFPVMLFAFSTDSSNATIPLNIETMEKDIGVSRDVASFTIPLGATINMDGTAIMQGVAVVFISQAYGIPLRPIDYVTVILTAVIASIGTAGIPTVGLVMLTMVLSSVGLPIEGISLIMGVDRIVDMCRTAVNITGDAVCTTVVAKHNGQFDKSIFLSDTRREEPNGSHPDNAETDIVDTMAEEFEETDKKA
ncbi:MAG: dicarboxylate/amino acid:cation symporter [Acutalibacteraceae bacterium]|nr:dicarboxylate/amino acid:cation symporter [Acutalibacteraceae bacterium]